MEVIYAQPGHATCCRVDLPSGATVADAVSASGMLERHPEIQWPRTPVGVFGRRADPGSELEDGDRVEIYRTLLVDPKERRRLRARR
ncbi:MAG: RnfH family protein [Salinisphaera sp.]|nr:RnfH family protein [Salinisphaera sp.]